MFPQITSPPQAQAEVIVNSALETLEHQAVYGKAQLTTSGLTWGYYGGRWGGFSVADGTLTLVNGTNYAVVHISTGVISVGTSSTNWNDTSGYARVYKITAAGGVVTAVEDHRAGPGGVHGMASGVATIPRVLQFAVSDESTALTTGAAKITLRAPYAMANVSVRASLSTAQTSGSIFTVDINEAGVSILSTKLTVDNGERTSTTAATPAVVSDTSIADDAEITVDIDQVGDGTAKGLKVTIIGTAP